MQVVKGIVALVLCFGIASCGRPEAERAASGVPRASRNALALKNHSEIRMQQSVYPVIDPETGCEYLMSYVRSGVALTIRYNRDGTVRCPGRQQP